MHPPRAFLFAAALGLVFGVACGSKPPCDASTCAGCCDVSGQCLGGTASAACGTGGSACVACTGAQTCGQGRCAVPGAGSDAGASDAGSMDGGPLDAGPGDAGWQGSRFWDGGACLVKTDCPCFSSDDCGPGFTCHSEDTTGLHVYCVPGARGAGGLNAPCTGEADCASALCVDADTTGMRCSVLCDEDAGVCAGALADCLTIGFGIERSICSPP